MILVGLAVLMTPSRVRAGCSDTNTCQGSNPPGCTDAACLDRCPNATSPGCGGGGGGAAALVDNCAAGQVGVFKVVKAYVQPPRPGWATCVQNGSGTTGLDRPYTGNKVGSWYGCRGWNGDLGVWNGDYGNWQEHGTCCTPTVPDKPTLVSPADGESVSSTPIVLKWDLIANWGGDCGLSDARHLYLLRVWEMQKGPPKLVFRPNLDRFTQEKIFLGIKGKTYIWRVVTTNGRKSTTSDTWRFTVPLDQISGRVYYDASDTCSTAVPWNQGTGMTVSANSSVAVPSGGASAGQWAITSWDWGIHVITHLFLSGIPVGFKCSSACGGCLW